MPRHQEEQEQEEEVLVGQDQGQYFADISLVAKEHRPLVEEKQNKSVKGYKKRKKDQKIEHEIENVNN